MRAFFTLIFFLIILGCGLLGGFLYARLGLPVPYVNDQIEALIPAGLGTGAQVADLEQSLETQKQISAQVDARLRQARTRIGELEAQNENLQTALNNPVYEGIEGSAASQALTNDLIEQNQFLTEELSALLSEKTNLEAQLTQVSQAAQEATQRANQALNASGNAAAANDQQVQALKQQVAQLLGEHQSLTQTLTETLRQKETATLNLQNIQSQFQNVLAQVQTNGGNVGQLLQNSGVDLRALAEGQGGQVLQNLVQGLGQ